MARLLTELRRRSVLRVAAAYLALAWLALQVIDTVNGLLDLPDWVGPLSLAVLAIGFPISIALAWIYDLTPEGVRSTDEADPGQPIARFGGRKIDFVIIGALSLVIVLLLVKDTIVPQASRDALEIPTARDFTRLTQSQIVFPPFASPYPLVADASRLYFNDFVSATMRVRQLAQTGGEAVPFDMSMEKPGLAIRPTAMTPDKSGVVMTWVDMRQGEWELELWVIPVVGGAPRKLGYGYNAGFSRDGQYISYGGVVNARTRQSELIIANVDMTEPRSLFETGEELTWIDFSPVDDRIRFSTWGRRPRIWETTIDGGKVRPMLPDWGDIEHCCGTWTPDGQYYVFQAKHDERTQVWAVRDSGDSISEPVQITAGALNFRRPTIAPDGKRIFAIGWQLRGEVVRYNSEVEQFVPVPGLDGLSGEWLSYSSDGNKFTYVSYPEGHLWSANVDGSDRTQLTFEPMRAGTGATSPDGQYVAFSGELPDDTRQIYIVPTVGGTPAPLTTKDTYEFSPTWSPDSSTIAFSRAGHDEILQYDIATQSVSPMPGTEGLRAPDWSPDGRYIGAWKDGGVVIVDVDTGERKQVLGPDADIQVFYWARDSQHIYYVDFLGVKPDGGVHRMNIADGSSELIAPVASVRGTMGVFGSWVGVDPEGAPLMLRDLSIHHIYELDWLPDATDD